MRNNSTDQMQPPDVQEKFYCAVVPTYNNAGTLEKVLTDVAQHTPYIIVVNDGSTDCSAAVLDGMQRCMPAFAAVSQSSAALDVIHFPANRGKGKALRAGFDRAADLGFRYAITIDSDGQHFADDIPQFIEMIQKHPDSLIVGTRNMRQDGVPGKSSFGNRVSSFWYRVETGIKLPDTQSGFRLYPVERLRGMRFFTHKYEFEIEVMVRAAWRGCRICQVPVHVYYAPEESRVSHFRPFRDFLRISLLNTVLVLMALLWIRPCRFIRYLNWKKIKRLFLMQLVSRKQNVPVIALSAGFGVFMGIIPIWGYQMLVGVTLAHFMRLNKVIVLIAANISFPPIIPVVMYLCFLAGGWFVDTPAADASIDIMSKEFIQLHLYQYLVGSIFSALASGVVATVLTWLIVSIMRRKSGHPHQPCS